MRATDKMSVVQGRIRLELRRYPISSFTDEPQATAGLHPNQRRKRKSRDAAVQSTPQAQIAACGPASTFGLAINEESSSFTNEPCSMGLRLARIPLREWSAVGRFLRECRPPCDASAKPFVREKRRSLTEVRV
ncbi:MAG: hypothetical protein RLY70_4097 [Planctomycetota bacterium]